MAVRGRPRSFDREQALHSALGVFCERGYDATTLQDLQAAMGGITPPSFYAAFGSKEALFLEAVDVYRNTTGGRPARALESQPTAQASIAAMLDEAIAIFAGTEGPRGCLVVLGGVNCTSPSVLNHLQSMRQQMTEMVLGRLERGVRDGDLPDGLDLPAIVHFYVTIIHGLALRARDGVSRKALRTSADGAMAAWKVLTNPPIALARSSSSARARRVRAARRS